ncbi:hypothetical protein GF359_07040 [candidate division WOR-3 bacterium]|uniref:Uncharacterized protein n=1 Tax=candidate division WOR-3 bacterium TaxID=2052148 RepID=A0A9D5KB76_UNCW3|nr:hypothetical protein [candidate division WOR-3 bacterium]MBD3364954.1 hypothetical protein [candidate division WOR-3 bacterium]
MKVLVGIIFGVLTALAVAGGVYLWMEMGEKYEDFFTERRELTEEIAGLKSNLREWNGPPKDAEKIGRKLDSLKDTLRALESRVDTLLTTPYSITTEPQIYLADPHQASSWRFYPFQLTVEDEQARVDSFMRNLVDILPLTRFHQIEAEWDGNEVNFVISGSVRFPAE